MPQIGIWYQTGLRLVFTRWSRLCVLFITPSWSTAQALCVLMRLRRLIERMVLYAHGAGNIWCKSHYASRNGNQVAKDVRHQDEKLCLAVLSRGTKEKKSLGTQLWPKCLDAGPWSCCASHYETRAACFIRFQIDIMSPDNAACQTYCTT